MSDLGWPTLFDEIHRTRIRRSCLQRQLLATLSLINNKKKERKKERIQKDSKHFYKHLT